MYYVYVLQSLKDHGYYIGYTTDMQNRLKQHNSGKTRSLKHRLPMQLIYWEEFEVKAKAKAREQQMKSWKSGEAFTKLLSSSPRLRRD